MLVIACLLGGLWGIETVGRLENPQFPIKNAYVITPYPGASAREVEQEVTDRIEAALQQLPYLEVITSRSVPGRSEVLVEVIETYDDDDLPQIWDELRRRVGEAAVRLPPGAGPPLVEDDFGDVYGILYAVRTPGYAIADVRDMARTLSARIKLVDGVAKVATSGVPEEAVHVELSQEQLVRLGLPADAVFAAIGEENAVVDAGSLPVGGRRLRLAPELAYDDVDAIRDLRIGRPGTTEFVSLGDVATVHRGPVEQPREILRHDGERVFTLGVSVTEGQNVVDVGDAVEARLDALLETLPVGVEVAPIHEQHEVVRSAIGEFLVNLVLSVATVAGTLCLFMGWRAGTVVGGVLLLTILGTLGLMSAFDIELQRISLGALMIAMGMLVDNAIVVAEGMVTGVERGDAPEEAAAWAVGRTAYPLLGATVIGVLAFAPIGLSAGDTGQFLNTLFWTVAMALALSWLLAVTVVPMLGARLLRAATPSATGRAGLQRPYRGLLGAALRHRGRAATVILLVSGATIYAFGHVEQSFFPRTNSPLFHVDYLLPEGTDLRATAADLVDVEARLLADAEVASVTSFIGVGATRYTATQRPEQPNPALAQLVVRVADVTRMDATMRRVKAGLAAQRPDAQVLVYRLEFSPGSTSKIEARFQGEDPDRLRALGEAALAVYREAGLVDRKLDWRQRELQIVPHYDADGARLAGVSRTDLADSLAYATTGVRIGLYREADDLLPIVARAPARERSEFEDPRDRMIWSPAEQQYVPVAQVVSDFSLEPQDSRILRRQRIRTLTAQANAPPGRNVEAAFAAIRPAIEALPLPPGYALEWGGEHESSAEAREKLAATIPPAFGLMFVITVLMFGTLRQPLVIWLTVPMVVGGVALALLATDMPFTFPASLGLLSLAGMLIKNCIVLADEIDKRMAEDGVRIDTLVAASASRLRPVLLASGTTIAGMSPLLADEFFAEMAMAIMGGLAFTTLLTLVAVPVFYGVSLGGKLAGAADRAA
jgi:multidrug efflux pump subunit AcrB